MTSSRKLHQFKRKKPIYKSRILWIGVLVLLVISVLTYLIAFLPFFQVEEISVSGNEKVEADSIKKIVDQSISRDLFFTSSRSVFLVRIGKARSELLGSLPVLCEAEMRRSPPDKLKVKVKERKPVGIFVGAQNYLIDKRGVVFQVTSPAEGFLIRKKDENARAGKKMISRETMDKILAIKSRLEEINLKNVTLSDSRLNAVTEAGWKIYFDLDKDWEWQVTKLKLAMEREISETEWKDLEYIDLRFDKIYYK